MEVVTLKTGWIVDILVFELSVWEKRHLRRCCILFKKKNKKQNRNKKGLKKCLFLFSSDPVPPLNLTIAKN